MPSKAIIYYTKIEREVSAIIARGTENLKAAYRRQVLATNWEVGRYLKETLPFDDIPSANNARMISRLAKKFDRPDTYFYRMIKFAKVYPRLSDNGSLSWSHYEVLLSIKDDARRRKYERMAARKRISSKILYGIIARDKAAGAAPGHLALISGQKNKKKIPFKRGKLYHYKVTAPKDAESNRGRATVDVGFGVYRDIPLSKKSKLHVGHMVRTVRSETSREIFSVKISQDNKDRLYTYMAAVERIVDGDTPILMIDLGLKTKTSQRLRLRGIDCPELTTKLGKHVKNYVKKLLDKQKCIIVKTYKDDKFGRMLVDIFYLPRFAGEAGLTGESDPHVVAQKGIYLNQQLVDEGLAQIWKG